MRCTTFSAGLLNPRVPKVRVPFKGLRGSFWVGLRQGCYKRRPGTEVKFMKVSTFKFQMIVLGRNYGVA